MIAYNTLIVISYITVPSLFLFELFLYFKFKKAISAAFKSVRVDNIELIIGYKDSDISRLYKSYKLLPTQSRTIIKMDLQSNDQKHDPIIQFIDLFSKLVLSVGIALMGVVMTMNASVLNFIQSDEKLKKNADNWIKTIQDTLDTFVIGLNGFQSTLLLCAIIFIFAAIHIYFSNKKQKIRSRHLIIIEQIEKEL